MATDTKVEEEEFRPSCVSYPSTVAFRHVVSNVRKAASKRGLEELPTIRFTGTVKLHGANVGVGLTRGGHLWVQSRRNVVTPTSDFCGVAKHVRLHESVFVDILERALDGAEDHVRAAILYGEWVGRGIQKGVAMSEVDPMFVAFRLKHLASGEEEVELATGTVRRPRPHTWLPAEVVEKVSYPEARLYNIHLFPSYEVTVDFNNPVDAQPTLDAITDEVERCCPVAKHFGVEGVGEGVVWVSHPEDRELGTFTFKVKGDKHAVVKAKSKTHAPVDVEKVASARAFAEYAVTPGRCEQGWDEVISKAGITHPTKRQMGAFMKWIAADVEKEEADTAEANMLGERLVKRAVCDAARAWFTAKLEELFSAAADAEGKPAGSGSE